MQHLRGIEHMKLSEDRWREAICPKCTKPHRTRIFWSSTAKIRVFCDFCKAAMQQSGYMDIDSQIYREPKWIR
jgi:hypothetical protein